LTSGANCGVPDRVPSPKFPTFCLRGVWTGIAESLRIVDWDTAQEILGLVFIEAVDAILYVGGAPGNDLNR
jgi:hypothetical protein